MQTHTHTHIYMYIATQTKKDEAPASQYDGLGFYNNYLSSRHTMHKHNIL